MRWQEDDPTLIEIPAGGAAGTMTFDAQRAVVGDERQAFGYIADQPASAANAVQSWEDRPWSDDRPYDRTDWCILRKSFVEI